MDVLPAAVGAALTLWVLLAHAEDRLTGGRAAVLAAFSLAIVGWFRVSVLPFLVLPTLIVLLRNETARPLRTLLVFGICLAACLTPILIYNTIRSGNPLALGTMHPRYADQNGFAGKFGEGLYGLLISPNHGLLVFAPWLVLGLSPAALRACSPRARLVLSALLIGVAAYTLLIAGLKQWAKVEWGPRYLVPVLPIIAVSAGAAAYQLWKTRWRPLVATLAVVSIVPSAAAGVVNYSYVMTEFPGASDPLAPTPQQITGSYRALLSGLRGDAPMAPDKVRADPERAAGLRIPDYWAVRLWQRGGIARVVGLTAILVLLVGLTVCLYRLRSAFPTSSHSSAV
jgi:hypothetical protein